MKGKFKLVMKNKHYAGKVAGINFYKGVGHTDDEFKAKRLAESLGYDLEVDGEEKVEDINEDNVEDEEGTDEEDEVLECPYCDKTYKTKSGLTRHINDKHEGEDAE